MNSKGSFLFSSDPLSLEIKNVYVNADLCV